MFATKMSCPVKVFFRGTGEVVIPNPTMAPAVQKASVKDVDGDRKILLCVGRFEAEKHHDILIDAFAQIADQMADWDLRLIGEGPLRANLEAQAASLYIENRVQFPGATSDISEAYLAAHLFVVPSRFESFGLATAEALSHGLPAVGFADCPGTNQLISHGVNGMLAPGTYNRSASLADQLAQLMQDEELRARLGEAARKRAKGLRHEDTIEAWEKAIETIVTQQATSTSA
jgi:glycosyltransferase involved in cell wall biosynthesis